MRRRWVGTLALSLLAGLARADVPTDEAPPDSPAVLATRSRLDWSGGASLAGFRPIGTSDLLVHLSLANPGEEPLSIREANLFGVGDGGWMTPLELDVLKGRLELGPKATKFIGENMAYSVPGGATHVLLGAAADDGHSEFAMPLLLSSGEPPERADPAYPLGVGVARPLEVLPFADGRSSLVLVGQVQSLTGATPRDVTVEALLADSTGAFEPETWRGLGGQEDRKRLWPFVRRLDVPEGFAGGVLRITVSATVGTEPFTHTAEWPVEATAPVAVQGPVLGSWHLVNGPGQTGLHANYRNPLWRWSYDFIVVEQGTTYRGAPHKKESYFAWARTVKAVAAGTVIDACDREVDNPGLGLAPASRGDCQGVNRVVVEHDDGVRTVYLHLQQRSLQQGIRPGIRVEAGQALARVGNSGESMEPHLHLVAYRLDPAGRPRPVALTFSNAYEDAGRQRPLKGVPVGGRTLHFVER
jgi:murein DD-endopeptidase MepM/ murein hydrolase activator NlpD